MLQYKKGNYYAQGEWKQGKGVEALYNDYDLYIKLCKEFNHVSQNRWDVEKWNKHLYHLKYLSKKSLNNQDNYS